MFLRVPGCSSTPDIGEHTKQPQWENMLYKLQINVSRQVSFLIMWKIHPCFKGSDLFTFPHPPFSRLTLLFSSELLSIKGYIRHLGQRSLEVFEREFIITNIYLRTNNLNGLFFHPLKTSFSWVLHTLFPISHIKYINLDSVLCTVLCNEYLHS